MILHAKKQPVYKTYTLKKLVELAQDAFGHNPNNITLPPYIEIINPANNTYHVHTDEHGLTSTIGPDQYQGINSDDAVMLGSLIQNSNVKGINIERMRFTYTKEEDLKIGEKMVDKRTLPYLYFLEKCVLSNTCPVESLILSPLDMGSKAMLNFWKALAKNKTLKKLSCISPAKNTDEGKYSMKQKEALIET